MERDLSKEEWNGVGLVVEGVVERIYLRVSFIGMWEMKFFFIGGGRWRREF